MLTPTIHYAALGWFYLLFVFSKRIVYNLAPTKDTQLACTGCTEPAELCWAVNKSCWSAPWEGSNCQCSQPRGKIQLCFEVQISCFKITVSWRGNTRSAFCYPFSRGEISATGNSYQSQPQLFTCSVQMTPTFSLLPGPSLLAYNNLL